jgi:hypothetical protein
MKQLPITFSKYLTLSVLLIFLVLVLPASKIVMQEYSIDASQYHLLLLLAELPLLALWFTAFTAYFRLHRYSILLPTTQEGLNWIGISRGFTWLAWGLAVSPLLSLLMNTYSADHQSFHAPAIIISNYLGILFPLVAFTFTSRHARGLLERADTSLNVRVTRTSIVASLIVGVMYCYLIFDHLSLHYPSNSVNTYYLPSWLVAVTIVVPSLYTWFIGVWSAFDISQLARRSPGLLYRRSLQVLSGGLIVVIGSLVAVQYLRLVIPRTGHLSINATFLTTNILYLAAMIGFLVMSIAIKQLQKIEEV